MAKGGVRNRNGAAPDPNSARSAKAGLEFDQLPSEGYQGDYPEFSLPDATDRELQVWDELWRTPQASAWAKEPWRARTVEMYTRWSVRSEGDVPAAFLGQVHRLGDQLGLTPAGLRENGWEIVRDQVAAKRSEKPAGNSGQMSARERRLKAVANAK